MSEPGRGGPAKLAERWAAQKGLAAARVEGLHLHGLNGPRGPAPAHSHKAGLVPRADSGGQTGDHSAISCPCQVDRTPGHPQGLWSVPPRCQRCHGSRPGKLGWRPPTPLPFLAATPGPPAPPLAAPACPGLRGGQWAQASRRSRQTERDPRRQQGPFTVLGSSLYTSENCLCLSHQVSPKAQVSPGVGSYWRWRAPSYWTGSLVPR